ncbi:inosine/xanthosine triphosphatase [Parendozoicomonas sp. Alg238-R29]|uniref:inosine/xanthosine triphosphatase n=1 Tax=Parendozoicomonas sp. Alg238-R29 TaxID=2993446 RepID=UPI00248F37D5|nr:inosine/xanthosine triphosphatase [Parendozoicomonas sp. Alg238-R29]
MSNVTTSDTINIIVASMNPAKIKAVESAFAEIFQESLNVSGIKVASNVAEQPMTNAETLLGARNRVNNAQKEQPSADYWVGLEAGIEGNHTFAWMVISNGKQHGEACSASLPLPAAALNGVKTGKELGDVMDEQFGTSNIKQKGGAIGLLTKGILTRSSVYHQALILALIPFVNEERF